MSNFDQPVYAIPTKGRPIVITLRSDWDAQLSDTERVITLPQERKILRMLGIRGNPEKVTISKAHPLYAELIETLAGFAQTSEQHVEKFADMSAQDKVDRQNRKIIAALREYLSV